MTPASPTPASVFISAGEPSGDLHAANLVKALRKIRPDITVQAMGGDALRAAGTEVLVDNRELAVMGLVEVIRHYPLIRWALKTLQAHLKSHPPDLLILVDYVEFNLKLAKTAKELGVKVLFYVSPQVWAWRQGRVKKIGKAIDMMATIFPFEVRYYEEENVPARYVGNPLVGKVKPSAPRDVLLAEFDLKGDYAVVSLQPGSRRNEIALLLPVFLETARILSTQRPEMEFVLPLAPGLDRDEFEQAIETAGVNVHLIDPGRSYDAMEVADAVLTASGTATLETALSGTPLVIAHKVSPITYAIFRRLIRIPYIGLVNIVAEKRIVAEFLQDAAKPETLANELMEIIEDEWYREEMKKNLLEVKQRLGETEGSQRVAELAAEMLDGNVEEIISRL